MKYLLTIVLMLLWMSETNVQADQTGTLTPVELRAKPTNCVALHKGQICYVSVLLSWQSTAGNTVCLHSDTHNTQLYCSADSAGSFLYDYASASDETFSLRLQNADQTVAKVMVKTAWVYRTGKRSSSGWRLF